MQIKHTTAEQLYNNSDHKILNTTVISALQMHVHFCSTNIFNMQKHTIFPYNYDKPDSTLHKGTLLMVVSST